MTTRQSFDSSRYQPYITPRLVREIRSAHEAVPDRVLATMHLIPAKLVREIRDGLKGARA